MKEKCKNSISSINKKHLTHKFTKTTASIISAFLYTAFIVYAIALLLFLRNTL